MEQNSSLYPSTIERMYLSLVMNFHLEDLQPIPPTLGLVVSWARCNSADDADKGGTGSFVGLADDGDLSLFLAGLKKACWRRSCLWLIAVKDD